MSQQKVIPLPAWWTARDKLTPGAVRTHYNHENSQGGRRWLKRWMSQYIDSLESLDEVIEVGNSLHYFSTELFIAVRSNLYRQSERLYFQGKRVEYTTRTLEILLPTLVEMKIASFVLPP